jgi:hypothetical protein
LFVGIGCWLFEPLKSEIAKVILWSIFCCSPLVFAHFLSGFLGVVFNWVYLVGLFQVLLVLFLGFASFMVFSSRLYLRLKIKSPRVPPSQLQLLFLTLVFVLLVRAILFYFLPCHKIHPHLVP